MVEIAFGSVFTLFTGIFGHLFFYPIIESWNNQRMRRLARPAIGVLLNAVPFLVWIKIIRRVRNDGLIDGFLAYCVSFLWNGAGVALGYLIDDWKYN